MLTLINQKAHVVNFNPRMEKHGTKKVAAADLRLSTIVHSSALDSFYPGLKAMLYRKRGADEPAPQQQENLFEGDDATALKLPHLAPLKWDESFPGYTAEIVIDAGLLGVVPLTEVTLSGFVLEAMDGGSVEITCSAKFQHDEKTAGRLCMVIDHDIEITLNPPQKQPELLDDGHGGSVLPDVLITAISLELDKKTQLTAATLVTDDGERYVLDGYAYRPTLSDLTDRLALDHGVFAQVADDVRNDYADKARAA